MQMSIQHVFGLTVIDCPHHLIVISKALQCKFALCVFRVTPNLTPCFHWNCSSSYCICFKKEINKVRLLALAAWVHIVYYFLFS